MRYEVTEQFYAELIKLVGIALDDDDPVEIDLAINLINDTVSGQEDCRL